MNTLLKTLLKEETIRPIDLHLGLFINRLAGNDNQEELALATALTSRATADGHLCLPLEKIGSTIPELQAEHPTLFAPAQLRRILLSSPAVGQPGEVMPLILDEDNKLYLHRYFDYEQRIAADLRQRAQTVIDVDTKKAQGLLAILFPQPEKEQTEDINWQQTAAALALLKQLLVITGGPGTGKTFTVARILALLIALAPGSLRIGLAAPTGKAAARLQESIGTAQATLPQNLTTSVPPQALTLHRLLGYRHDSAGFRHHRTNPLPLDILVLDEVSMVDVPLLAALLDALPMTSRLILLGDRNQLASVEAGNFFADICGDKEPAWSRPVCTRLKQLTGQVHQEASIPSPMGDSYTTLKTSYRFQSDSGIGQLATAINSGDTKLVKAIYARKSQDLNLMHTTGKEFNTWLEQQTLRTYGPLFKHATARSALSHLGRYRILCALREGPNGVAAINQMSENILRRNGLIPGREQWYCGKPIMIMRNHYGLQLFNGDTGIAWPDDNGRLYAWFMQTDNELHPVALSRLPEHQTAFAITVHKSQGSEFDEILLLLPDRDAQVLTRELLYTGLTRARSKITIHGKADLVKKTILRHAQRHSGLHKKLHL